MKITWEEMRDIARTLPIGYYLGRKVPVMIEPAGGAYCDPVKCEIHVGMGLLQTAADHIDAKDAAKWSREKLLRCLLYHEVGHLLLTPPKLKRYVYVRRASTGAEGAEIINIFEDERLEAILSRYFLGVDFKAFVNLIYKGVEINGKSAKDKVYKAVRLRKTTPEISAKVDDAINATKQYTVVGPSSLGTYEDALNDLVDAILDAPEDESEESSDGKSNDKSSGGSSDKASGDESGGSESEQDESSGGESGESEDDESEDDESKDDADNADGESDEDESDDKSKDKSKDEDESEDEPDDESEDGASDEDKGTEEDNPDGGGESEETPEDGESKDGGKPEDDDGAGGMQKPGKIELPDNFLQKLANKVFVKPGSEVSAALRRFAVRLSKKKGAQAAGRWSALHGRIDVRRDALDKERIFRRRSDIGESLMSATHLVLWIDKSGSFSGSVNILNQILAATADAMKMSGGKLTVDVVKMDYVAHVAAPNDWAIVADSGNCVSPSYHHAWQATRKKDRRNIDIVVFDGDCGGQSYRVGKKVVEEVIWDHPDCHILTDEWNRRYFGGFTKAHVTYMNSGYAEMLQAEVLKILDRIL